MGSGYELARAIQRCVSAGHPVERAWQYTPRQLAGWGEIIERERIARNLDLARAFRIGNSDQKAYKEASKKMEEFSQ